MFCAGAQTGCCAAAPTDGEACPDGRCGEGLRCVDGTCDDGCSFDSECGSDEYWCDHPDNDYRTEIESPELRGACAPKVPLGSPCEDIFHCAEGYCDNVNGFDADGYRNPGMCREPRGPGSPCDEPADCDAAACGEDGLCPS